MITRAITILFIGILFASAAPRACADDPLTTKRLYNAVNQPIPFTITPPDTDAPLRLLLIDPLSREVIGSRPVSLTDTDLSRLFPILWTTRRPRLLLLQLEVDAEPTGAPLVLEPLLTPTRHRSAWLSQLDDAASRRDADALNRLLALTSSATDRLRSRIAEVSANDTAYSGLRIYPARTVILRTDLGDIELRLFPEHAPKTVFRFLHLVEGGFYDNLSFHRTLSTDHSGNPFLIQTGDPTATGRGGAGEWSDYEPSKLPHTFGTVSIARRSDDPNTNAGQFFICLSRAACAHLDDHNTVFARIVRGAETIRAIALKPSDLRDPDDPTSPKDRPIEPVLIREAITQPSPAWGHMPAPLEEADAYPRGR